jgi:hypothetical protein
MVVLSSLPESDLFLSLPSFVPLEFTNSYMGAYSRCERRWQPCFNLQHPLAAGKRSRPAFRCAAECHFRNLPTGGWPIGRKWGKLRKSGEVLAKALI